MSNQGIQILGNGDIITTQDITCDKITTNELALASGNIELSNISNFYNVISFDFVI